MRVGLYLLKEIFKALNVKSLVLSGLAVLACFVTLSGLILITSAGGGYLFGPVKIVALLRDDATPAEINQLALEIQSWHEVASLPNYVPKEAAKKPLSKGVLEITLKDPKDVHSVSATLQDPHRFPQIERVIAPKPSPLSLYLQEIPQQEAVIWGALAFMFLISILMIRFAIGSLARSFAGQIEILKLAGVSPGTIRLPFVLMGILYGLLGGAATALIFYLAPSMGYGFGEADSRLALVSSGGLGVLLGILGSLFSLRLGHRVP